MTDKVFLRIVVSFLVLHLVAAVGLFIMEATVKALETKVAQLEANLALPPNVTQERRQLFSKTLYLSSDTNTTCDSTTSTLYTELQRMSELSRAQALRYKSDPILSCGLSAIADHMTQTGHRIKWDHFDILATGQSDIHCKIKEALLIRDLKPALNENIGSEKLLLY